jgi:multidrug resistance efflux pump
VAPGQVLAEMDPIDLDERIVSLTAAVHRADANLLATASSIEEASARATYANTQADRYEQLLRTGAVVRSLSMTNVGTGGGGCRPRRHAPYKAARG